MSFEVSCLIVLAVRNYIVPIENCKLDPNCESHLRITLSSVSASVKMNFFFTIKTVIGTSQ